MKTRLLSLDVFRGMTVFFMIIVNSSGNGSTTYAPLKHAAWHGFTPTDLVFPSFLFAVGASIFLVMPRWKTLKRKEVYTKIIRRTVIIFLLGYLMYWFPFFNFNADGSFTFRPVSETRIMGVLQRIALCFGFTSLLFYHFKPRTVFKVGIGILISYWLLLVGFGDLSLNNNLPTIIDEILLGSKHLYKGEGVPFDPEGLFSTLPSMVNVMAGFGAAQVIINTNHDYKSKLRLLLIGVLFIGLACSWHYAFPINKKLWTSSYALLTCGIGICMLVGLHQLLDNAKAKQAWANFFTPMGKNPLFIYLLSEFGIIMLAWWPSMEYGNMYVSTYKTIFEPFGSYFGAFLFAFSWTMICWLVAWWMDKKSWFIRV